MARSRTAQESIRIPLEEHAADAAALLAPLHARTPVRLGADAIGRIIAHDVRARVDVPSADNSQMDGYAVARADLVGAPLRLGPTIAAGDAPSTLEPGTARPIMTGAPMPVGADLVVPVEESAEGAFPVSASLSASASDTETVAEAAGENVILHPQDSTVGRYVRRRGSDTYAGDTVLRAGAQLTPARIAHLAACGIAEVEVLAPIRVLVLSTGSEVAPASEVAPSSTGASAARSTAAGAGTASPGIPAGGAFDANGPGLAAALAEAGAEVVSVGTVPDDPEALLQHLCAEVERTDADLIVTSGGVSAGAFEVVRQAAELPGAVLTFPKVAMQPGGPQGIGTLDLGSAPGRSVGQDGAPGSGRRVPWLAFPGNPVSALLSCELIARPALRAPARQRLRLPILLEEGEVSSPADLAQLRRARVLPSGRVRLVGGPSSHLIGGLAAADALVLVPVGVDRIADGDLVETILIPGGER